MVDLQGKLNSGRVLIADGATGTNLQQVGLVSGGHTEDWILEHPERILALERAFVEAGSNIILTCTFGGTGIRMEGSRHKDRVREINMVAASIARQAAHGHDVIVAGSMGPLGKLLKPFGPLSYEEAVTAYADQAGALVAGGVDMLVIETQFSLDEARAALEGAGRESSLPTVVSFSFDRGTRTMMGVSPEQVAQTFIELGAAMIGVNCGTTLKNAVQITKSYSAAAPGFPLWVKPNAGLPRLENGSTVYDVTPDEMASFAGIVTEHGARVVGGCCGSTPAHVAAIARALAAVD